MQIDKLAQTEVLLSTPLKTNLDHYLAYDRAQWNNLLGVEGNNLAQYAVEYFSIKVRNIVLFSTSKCTRGICFLGCFIAFSIVHCRKKYILHIIADISALLVMIFCSMVR